MPCIVETPSPPLLNVLFVIGITLSWEPPHADHVEFCFVALSDKVELNVNWIITIFPMGVHHGNIIFRFNPGMDAVAG